MAAVPAKPDTPRTLFVTNDFPPRVGGVQQYVWNLTRNLPAERVAVLAPNWPGWREHDRAQPFAVHRWPSTSLWPTSDLTARVSSLVREHGAEVVVFGHGFPLPTTGPSLLHAGIPYVVLTHGAEVWLARIPGAAAAMRRAFQSASAVTAVSEYTGRTIGRLLPNGVRPTVLYPGVDDERFSPKADGEAIRQRHFLGERPIVLCVSRLVPRKGEDILIRGLAMVRSVVPGTTLVLAGDGPHRPYLATLAAEAPAGSVVFAGAVPDEELPSYYAACDVFAMPCRSRWGGLEVEGFGIVYLEAAASGKPVVAGRSGGAHEAIADEKTGLLTEGREPKAVSLAVSRLLHAPAIAERMGSAGRSRVEDEFTWQRQAARLSEILAQAVGQSGNPKNS
jgi:phosphatidylinositol alpha-1,6-mannosyltransferase